MITKNYGTLVRVKPEVEELVKELSEYMGYQRYTIRNVAILLGLQLITRGMKIPEYDEEFEYLLEITREDVDRFLRGV